MRQHEICKLKFCGEAQVFGTEQVVHGAILSLKIRSTTVRERKVWVPPGACHVEGEEGEQGRRGGRWHGWTCWGLHWRGWQVGRG